MSFTQTLDERYRQSLWRKTSPIWKFFVIADDSEGIAICRMCDNHLSYRSTISNLKRHVKRAHGHLLLIQ
nr:unnamed protein product [Callosobruchus analis]